MKQTSHPFSTDHFLHGGDYNPDQWLDRPDILEKIWNILKKQESTDAPTTWEEFEEDCQKIADQGEIPVIVGGSDAWQLMRYLSFSPWRVTGPEFIQGYQAGTGFL